MMATITRMDTATVTAMSIDRGAVSDVAPSLNDAPALLRLIQLVSPALPIGAYAYSHGLEWAIAEKWVSTDTETEAWIHGLLQHAWARLDVPVLARLIAAQGRGDAQAMDTWAELLHASRESAELQAEDRFMGQALARLLTDLGIAEARRWIAARHASFPALWACAAVHWNLPTEAAAWGLLWTYAEHQVAAAVKLVPLGQTAGQRMLGRLGEAIPAAVRDGLALDDADIGAVAPGLGIASALHETQYTRLFRS
jgi:urease accessory protein